MVKDKMANDNKNYGFRKIEGMDEKASVMMPMVLFGGPEVGFLTNPKSSELKQFLEINGEKVVCTAQGGECRYNPKYYTSSLNNAQSWTTPIIDETCPNKCVYKHLVCDNHKPRCDGSFKPYNEYNKFRGQYQLYCRNFSKLEGKVESKSKSKSK